MEESYELEFTLTQSAASDSLIKDESIKNKCLSMWMVYVNEVWQENGAFGCCVAASGRLILHRVKTQRLKAEYEADIVLRVMKYSAGESAEAGWWQARGGSAAKRRHGGAEGSREQELQKGTRPRWDAYDDGASAGKTMKAADIRVSGNEEWATHVRTRREQNNLSDPTHYR